MYGPLSLAAKLLWLLETSAILRGEATVRVTCAGNGCSLGDRLCGDSAPIVRPIEGRGEADILVGGGYGLLQVIGSVGDKPAGERPLGERRPNEPMLVMLLAVRLLAKLPLLLTDDTLDEFWGIAKSRGVGEPLVIRPPSLLLSRSFATAASSLGGDEALRF